MGYALSTDNDGRVQVYAPGQEPERQTLTVDQALHLAQSNLQGREEPWAQLVYGLLWQVREARWERNEEARPAGMFENTRWPDAEAEA